MRKPCCIDPALSSATLREAAYIFMHKAFARALLHPPPSVKQRPPWGLCVVSSCPLFRGWPLGVSLVCGAWCQVSRTNVSQISSVPLQKNLSLKNHHPWAPESYCWDKPGDPVCSLQSAASKPTAARGILSFSEWQARQLPLMRFREAPQT